MAKQGKKRTGRSPSPAKKKPKKKLVKRMRVRSSGSRRKSPAKKAAATTNGGGKRGRSKSPARSPKKQKSPAKKKKSPAKKKRAKSPAANAAAKAAAGPNGDAGAAAADAAAARVRRSAAGAWYISADGFRAIDAYKYKGGAYSTVDLWLNPFWLWSANRLPLWMAPNLVTLLGLLWIVASYFVGAHFAPSLREEAPRWTYFFHALAVFMYQTLDAMDGKQARRTARPFFCFRGGKNENTLHAHAHTMQKKRAEGAMTIHPTHCSISDQYRGG